MECFNLPSFSAAARRVALALAVASAMAGCGRPAPAAGGPPGQVRKLDQVWFAKQRNRLVGVGGEILINKVVSGDDPATPGVDPDGQIADPDLEGPTPAHLIQRLDIGDWLVGIGVTQRVECLDCADRVIGRRLRDFGIDKAAMRGFEVLTKERFESGYRYTFRPLSPSDYANAVAEASGGAVTLDPSTIPEGTMVVSFEDRTPGFTLAARQGSPGFNWMQATNGTRHWNVGVARPTDFWMAEFPTDDVGMLPLLAEGSRVGKISFGLSLLRGGEGEYLAVEPIPCEGPKGSVTVDVCLTGAATGTKGSGSAFPIGLSTEVRLRPTGRAPERRGTTEQRSGRDAPR